LQSVLNVSGDACCSIENLIAHLHAKLEIPMEQEFVIFTDDADDGKACIRFDSKRFDRCRSAHCVKERDTERQRDREAEYTAVHY
jgi:hypothetical protein